MRLQTELFLPIRPSSRFLGTALIAVSSLFAAIQPAGADDPTPDGAEFRMGTGQPGTFADYPAVGVDPSGNFVVVWEEFQVPGQPDQSRTGIQGPAVECRRHAGWGSISGQHDN